MNYLKVEPVGKDTIIQPLQIVLYDGLIDRWSVALNGYGRCYSVFNYETNKKEIQHFKGKNDYDNLVVAEGNKFFFTANSDEKRVGNSTYKTNVELYFILDLAKIYPDIAHRADEEVRKDVINIIESKHGFVVTNVITDIDKVFNRFEYDYTDDMQPYHCFKIELETVEYDINQNYCI